MKDEPHYRQATREEFQQMLEWAAAEGWNPGLDDAEVFWDFDPDGFVCAEWDGQMVASGSIVSYGAYGFMGFFIVRPELRGRGVGRRFWHWRKQRLLSRLSGDGCVGMDGVFAMQPFYSDGGFVFSHRNLRMETVGRAASSDPGICLLDEVSPQAVYQFDRRYFGCDREQFLRRWVRLPHGLALGYRVGDCLQGLGVIRQCREGFKIGPLFADEEQVADSLFASLSDHARGRTVYLDVPEINEHAMNLARRHGMTEVFGCARMYCGGSQTIPWNGVYGITTFELG